MISSYLGYLAYAREDPDDIRRGFKGPLWLWALREMYWDYFPSRFDAYWARRHK